MKYLHISIELGFIILCLTGLTPGKSLAALPLQVGVYHGGGSRYIQIAEKQNRICFKGFSSNGVTVASIVVDTNRQDFYNINGFEGNLLFQQDKETLLFGRRNQLSKYTADYGFPRDLGNDLEECLNSQKPFFRQKSGGRGTR